MQRFKDIFVEIKGGENYDSRDGIPSGQLAGGPFQPVIRLTAPPVMRPGDGALTLSDIGI